MSSIAKHVHTQSSVAGLTDVAGASNLDAGAKAEVIRACTSGEERYTGDSLVGAWLDTQYRDHWLDYTFNSESSSGPFFWPWGQESDEPDDLRHTA